MEEPSGIRGEDLLKKFKSDRYNLIDKILKNPDILRKKLWATNGLLWYDRDCKCNMANSYVEFSCKACSTFGRLVELDSKLGKIVLSCGDKGEVHIRITSQPAITTKINSSSLPNLQIKKLLANGFFNFLQNPKLDFSPIFKELKHLEDAEFYECDPYTTQVIIGIFVNRLAADFKIRVPELLTGFICGNSGYFIREDSEGILKYIKSIYKYLEGTSTEKKYFNEVDTKKILYSLLLTLYRFSKVGLILGRPDINCIRILHEENEYVINGKKLELSVLITIEPTILSSITTNFNKKYRFCATDVYTGKILIDLILIQRLKFPF